MLTVTLTWMLMFNLMSMFYNDVNIDVDGDGADIYIYICVYVYT